MDPSKSRVGAVSGEEERRLRHRLIEQGAVSQAGCGWCPSPGASSASSPAPPSSPAAPVIRCETEVECLRGHLGALELALGAAEAEVETVHGQLAVTNGRVAGRCFFPSFPA